MDSNSVAAHGDAIGTAQWIAWVMASAGVTFSLLYYADTKYETKDKAETVYTSLDKRLERIENKLDQIAIGRK